MMGLILIIGMVVTILGCILLALLIYRNGWILDERLELIDCDFVKYKLAWSYNKMFWHFWIWDINKMIYSETKPTKSNCGVGRWIIDR